MAKQNKSSQKDLDYAREYYKQNKAKRQQQMKAVQAAKRAEEKKIRDKKDKDALRHNEKRAADKEQQIKEILERYSKDINNYE